MATSGGTMAAAAPASSMSSLQSARCQRMKSCRVDKCHNFATRHVSSSGGISSDVRGGKGSPAAPTATAFTGGGVLLRRRRRESRAFSGGENFRKSDRRAGGEDDEAERWTRRGVDGGGVSSSVSAFVNGGVLRRINNNDGTKTIGDHRSDRYYSVSRRGGGGGGGVRCAAEGGTQKKGGGFFERLGRVLKEKAKSDIERIFSGVRKSRDNLAIVDELLTYWNLNDAETTLEELEEALLVSDFGPRTALKIIDKIRDDIRAGKLKTGPEIKEAMKKTIVTLLTENVASTELRLGSHHPAVVMVVGVNGGGKTTTIGKLAYRLKKEGGAKILMAAGDTFRAAAGEQLEVWAERTGSDIVQAEERKTRPGSVLSRAVRKAVEDGDVDVVLADTSGRLHTNFDLMEELKGCKRAITRALDSAPHEVLLVLDGTTGLNMLPQAREFNQVVGVTGFVLTKLDGTARGGCVVSVVDALHIPVKFIGVGEGLDDLQPFDAQAFVDALLPS